MSIYQIENVQPEELNLEEMDNPDIIGPGTWALIHKIGWISITLDKFKQNVSVIRVMIENFGSAACICREHALEHLRSDPPEEYIKMIDRNGRLIGLAYWGWKFHNAVNQRLGKPILPWEEFVDFMNSRTQDRSRINQSPPRSPTSSPNGSPRSNLPITMNYLPGTGNRIQTQGTYNDLNIGITPAIPLQTISSVFRSSSIS